jgi:hypothetical protein
VFNRYIAFVYPPLFLLAGWVLAEFASRSSIRKSVAVSVIAVVVTSGVVSGLAMRATGHRTHHVAVLRVIAQQVKTKQLASVCVEADPNLRTYWSESLRILMNGDLPPCSNGRGMIVRVDSLGLPHAAVFIGNVPSPRR